MIKRLLLKLIWFYQHAISPYKGRCNPFVKGGYDPVPVKGAVNVKKITK